MLNNTNLNNNTYPAAGLSFGFAIAMDHFMLNLA